MFPVMSLAEGVANQLCEPSHSYFPVQLLHLPLCLLPLLITGPHDPTTRLELCPQQRMPGEQGAVNSRLMVCLWFTVYFHNSLLIWSFPQPTGKIYFTSPRLQMKKKTPQIHKMWGSPSVLCNKVLQIQDFHLLRVLFARVQKNQAQGGLLSSCYLSLIRLAPSQEYKEIWNYWPGMAWHGLTTHHREGTASLPRARHLSPGSFLHQQQSAFCWTTGSG